MLGGGPTGLSFLIQFPPPFNRYLDLANTTYYHEDIMVLWLITRLLLIINIIKRTNFQFIILCLPQVIWSSVSVRGKAV